MAKSGSVLKPRGFGKTSRRDTWWAQPLVTFLVLSLFIVYATWAAFQGDNYHYFNYLSPFYSPELFGSSPHRIFGPKPGWWPTGLPFSPALLILPFPALFRFTCYYYRGAYYKAFWADPPNCAVSEPRKGYTGENGLPLILQNVHRYFMYAALIFLLFLWHDAFKSFWFPDTSQMAYFPKGLGPFPNVPTKFGMGLGTLVLLTNTTLLTFYTISCHSFRHLIGGRKDCISKSKASFACYSCVSNLNARHMNFAWFSLFGVMLADLYVRLCAMGVIHDIRFF
ncbi:MAG: succinate dehydrogenase [Armatimonadetes bacterium]|nr:succinate dehydrogenase [Armatimonadota bacterium]